MATQRLVVLKKFLKMIVSAIAAISRNRCIGRDNDIPWDVPADMRYFMRTTTGHYIIMGRKNFESINSRPLPRRTNVVITRQENYRKRGIVVVKSIEEGLTLARFNGETEAFIIGGGMIYELAFERDLIDRLYLTELDLEVPDCTVFFPQFDPNKWLETSRKEGILDEKNTVKQTYLIYERKR